MYTYQTNFHNLTILHDKVAPQTTPLHSDLMNFGPNSWNTVFGPSSSTMPLGNQQGHYAVGQQMGYTSGQQFGNTVSDPFAPMPQRFVNPSYVTGTTAFPPNAAMFGNNPQTGFGTAFQQPYGNSTQMGQGVMHPAVAASFTSAQPGYGFNVQAMPPPLNTSMATSNSNPFKTDAFPNSFATFPPVAQSQSAGINKSINPLVGAQIATQIEKDMSKPYTSISSGQLSGTSVEWSKTNINAEKKSQPQADPFADLMGNFSTSKLSSGNSVTSNQSFVNNSVSVSSFFRAKLI